MRRRRARAADFPWVLYGSFALVVAAMAIPYDLVFVRRAGGPPLQTALVVAFGQFGLLLLTGVLVYVTGRTAVRPFLESAGGYGVAGARRITIARKTVAISVSLATWIVSLAVTQIAFMVWSGGPGGAAGVNPILRGAIWAASALVIVTWVGYRVAEDVTRDVRFVTEQLRRLADGDGSARSVVQATSADEVGDLVIRRRG